MSRTAIGVFEPTEAEQVLIELRTEGIPTEEISVISHDGNLADQTAGVRGRKGLDQLVRGLHAANLPGIGSAMVAGPIGEIIERSPQSESDALLIALLREGVPENMARAYVVDIQQGGAMVAVRVPDEDLPSALDVLRRHAPSAQRGTIGGARTSTEGRATPAQADISSRTEKAAGDVSMPVIEEELVVGKRAVERGGVRAHTEVTEKPAETTVPLREERVKVERHTVDKPVTTGERLGSDQTIEVRAMGEEPVVEKRARVVEEVVISKEVEERPEQIRETVRREDVVIEPLAAERIAPGIEEHEPAFKEHHLKSGVQPGEGTYEDYSPAYRYGYKLKHHAGEGDTEWSGVETRAKTEWETHNPNTWDRFKDAIKHAFGRARKP